MIEAVMACLRLQNRLDHSSTNAEVRLYLRHLLTLLDVCMSMFIQSESAYAPIPLLADKTDECKSYRRLCRRGKGSGHNVPFVIPICHAIGVEWNVTSWNLSIKTRRLKQAWRSHSRRPSTDCSHGGPSDVPLLSVHLVIRTGIAQLLMVAIIPDGLFNGGGCMPVLLAVPPHTPR